MATPAPLAVLGDGSLPTQILSAVMQGGPRAIIALLLLMLGALLIERQRLVRDIAKLHDRVDQIVDRMHAGQVTVAEALASLRDLVREIAARQ